MHSASNVFIFIFSRYLMSVRSSGEVGELNSILPAAFRRSARRYISCMSSSCAKIQLVPSWVTRVFNFLYTLSSRLVKSSKSYFGMSYCWSSEARKSSRLIRINCRFRLRLLIRPPTVGLPQLAESFLKSCDFLKYCAQLLINN